MVIDLSRDAILTALMVAAPMLLVALGVGLIVSIIQSVTQIQEQTLTFVPKIITTIIVLIIFAGWMLATLREFASRVLDTTLKVGVSI